MRSFCAVLLAAIFGLASARMLAKPELGPRVAVFAMACLVAGFVFEHVLRRME